MPADVPRPALLGPYGPAQIACLRSWRQLGLAPLYIYIGSRPLPLASRIAAAVLHLPGALVGTDEGASRVVAFLRDHCADGVTCLAENLAHWLHTMTQRTDWPEAVACWISDAEALERLASKAEQVDIARRVGLKVLPSFLIDHKSAGAVPEDAYPLVLRPDTPGAVAPSFKALRVPDRARLEAFLAEVRRIDRPLVAQRLVVGPNLVVHGARAPTGEVFALQAFRADRKADGVTLRLRGAALTPELAAPCIRFADAIGVTGCFHFEFIEDSSGRPWFLEMNGRLGGTTAKVFALGYDEPRHLLAAFLPELREPATPLPARGCVVGRQALVKAVARRLRGRHDPLDYPVRGIAPTVLEAVWGFLAWREETYRVRYPLTTLSYALTMIAGRRRATVQPASDLHHSVREETPP